MASPAKNSGPLSLLVTSRFVAGKRILLFDDVFRSGATMNSITAALYDQGGAAEVCALTLTRTRSKQ